ncbi:MAG: S41 family peptidase [Wenzhouxiangellaceae bacterium]
MKKSREVLLALAATVVMNSVVAQQHDSGTQMLRFPDLHGDQVAFSYAGDIWLAPVDGQTPARRLTSHPGLELFPKFSPDGTQIAFTGQYRGDDQVYVIDINGGEPKQLTYYPTSGPLPARWGTGHQVFGWTADGSAVLFRTSRDHFDFRRLYKAPVAGGLPTALPMPQAGSGDYSPDGEHIVYSPLFRDFRTWKRYQGGWAQNLYIYDLAENRARQITDHVRTERDPVWLESGIYYVSDQDGTLELFTYDSDSGNSRQLTRHDDWDIKWASGDGDSRIVYELGGQLALFDTASGRERRLSIHVPDDEVRRSARRIPVGEQVEDIQLSPDGKRALLTGRGDVFSVPVEHGVTRNLTQRGDAHDRGAAWSPDGRHIAFISDRSGEQEIYLAPQDGGEARQLTDSEHGHIYQLTWSPDSKAIAFHDHRGYLRMVDLDGDETEIAHSPYGPTNDFKWSPDSQWLAFSRQNDNGIFGLYLWSRASGEVQLATDPLFMAYSPSFSPDGQYLYYVSDREFAPQIGSFEWNYVVDRESRMYGLALTKDAPNPFAPRNDETALAEGDEKSADDDKEDAVKVTIDFDGLAQRAFQVPVEATNLQGLQVTEKHILYLTGGPFYYGRQSDQPATLYAFDIAEREAKEVAANINDVVISDNGQYALVRQNGGIQRYEIGKPDAKQAVNTGNMIVYRSPAEEWSVVFDEVWRRFRDYFYVRNMHGYDWQALRDRYRPLVDAVSTREDLNYLMGEMIAELNVGHAYVSGGDLQDGERSSVALLGARFELDEASGRYRIAHIHQGHNEEPGYRSPLTEVGVNVNEGDYLLAIDGRELNADNNPYALLTDRGDQPVELLVNSLPRSDGARRVLVQPISSEAGLVYLEWVMGNQQYVTEQTDGKVGYLHIPDMGASGIYEFIKWFYPQLRKQGLVIDVRGNGGGNVSSMILQRLMKKPLAFGYRAHSDWAATYPPGSFNGPMVALINETSASDGDIFPHFFRAAGLGPLIGKRSWGGVVGITGHGPVIDGGDVFVPEFGLGDADNNWIIEGEGVAPDIEVQNDPASDDDAQLDRGIAEVLQRIEANPPVFAPKPPEPVKVD